MSGLLAGLLGVLALPPLSIEPAGWVWLVPWITTLNHPLPERLTAALLTAGLPLGVAVAPAAASEPALTGLVIVAVLAPFIVTTGLAAGRTGATSIPRIGAALVGFCCLLAGLRAVGLPMSLGLFLPAGDAHFPIIALAGPFVADLAIMLINTALAVSGMQARPAGAKPPALQPVLAASLGLAPLGLAEIEPIAGDGDERLRIAVVQTDITPQTRQRIVGDGELEALQRRQRHQARIAHRLDADRIVWPESSMPGLLRPGWTTAAVPGHHLRHGYAYSRPGHLRSEVRGRQGDDPSRIGSDQRWTKRFPLPFAERERVRAHPAGIADDLASGITVLICSDALHPRAVDRAAAGSPQVILNPANTAYLGSLLLPHLHQRSVHTQAARTGIAFLIAANAGPSAMLQPNGAVHRLAGAYTQGVALAPPPQATRVTGPPASLATLALALGWIGCAGARRPWPSPVVVERRASRWIAVGLAVLIISIAIAWQSFSTERLSAAATPRHGAPVTMDAVQSSASAHAGALALLARSFGVTTTAKAIPAEPARAIRWLCERTGLRLHRSTGPIEPPAFGLRAGPSGLQAIRWRTGQRPLAYDGVNATFSTIDPQATGIRWLTTVETPDRCRSHPRIRVPTSGASHARSGFLGW